MIEQLNDWKKLPPAFYERPDVVGITRELIGKILVSIFDNAVTAGRIVEAEAYNGPFDKASHSYANRRTKRTEVMYGAGGVAYVYLCYGMHQMFNVVTNVRGIPNAILIRAVEPLVGIETMLERSKKLVHTFNLTRGPGNVAKALGIHTRHTGMNLQSEKLFIADDGLGSDENDIAVTTRIGVDYAGEDAMLPYRFISKRSKYVSGKRSKE